MKYNAKEDDELDESRSNGESLSEHFEEVDEGRIGNVSEERTQKEGSINDCPSEDYIQTGGGFCADEATDDYRVIGGGFCVDEDETAEENTTDDAEMLKMESEERRKKGKRRNEEDASLEENVEIGFGNSSTEGLSAMPFLKRKKRKN